MLIKTIALKDTATHYIIGLEPGLVEDGPTIFERRGKPVAVLLPAQAYQAFQEWQSSHTRETFVKPVDSLQ